MQAAKDTFLTTLAGRLAVVNPARTVTLDGASRPAVLAVENETAMPSNTVLEAFLLNWEGASHAWPEGQLTYVDCKVNYCTKGSAGMLGGDRGRTATAMDEEFIRICEPRWAACCDYTVSPPAVLGSNIFWTLPVMAPSTEQDGILQHTAAVRVFYFPEGA